MTIRRFSLQSFGNENFSDFGPIIGEWPQPDRRAKRFCWSIGFRKPSLSHFEIFNRIFTQFVYIFFVRLHLLCLLFSIFSLDFFAYCVDSHRNANHRNFLNLFTCVWWAPPQTVYFGLGKCERKAMCCSIAHNKNRGELIAKNIQHGAHYTDR